MVIKYNTNSYVNVDEISALSSNVEGDDPTQWTSSFVVAGHGATVYGKPAKSILEAFLWCHRQSIYDMVIDSPTYKKQEVPV
jgi:hypothetical protein